MTRIALDSNVLAYLAGVVRAEADTAKVACVRDLVARLAASADLVAPVQALGELFVVLRRGGASAGEARALLIEMAETFETPVSAAPTALAAADLAVAHGLQFWDSLILSAAAEAGCAMLLSEDMQHGFVTRGVTVVDPFAGEMHPKLAGALKS